MVCKVTILAKEFHIELNRSHLWAIMENLFICVRVA